MSGSWIAESTLAILRWSRSKAVSGSASGTAGSSAIPPGRTCLGHGTAVAATIRGHAPEAALYSIRVFHRTLAAHFEAIRDAIEWGVEARLDLLNLSLGCSNREKDFDAACAHAASRGVAICAAGNGGAYLAVAADYELEGESVRFDGRLFHASPWARQRGALPREKNFHGTSFAVAHVTGMAARILSEGERSLEEALARMATG